MTDRRLPEPVFVLILIATGMLWLILVAVLVGTVLAPFSGVGGINLLDVIPPIGDSALQAAVGAQVVTTALALLIGLVMGTIISITHISGSHGQAVRVTLLFLRITIGIIIVRFLVSMAVPYVTGGLTSVLPMAFTSLPVLLVEIAFLWCADRFLSRPDGSIF